MKVTSTAFPHGGEIPRRYTKDGADVSPPLAFEDLPPGTRSLALIVDDPDAPDPAAPKRIWVHWVLVDLPPDTAGLPEGVPRLPGGSVGKNDWGHARWEGPAPPIGRHRYRFKLYALDRALGLVEPDRARLEAAMQGHTIEQAELIGTYERARPG
jgi:Raf kinase inhibitor-like YbhB/YbcL family protein